jgi:hypothetical protein
MEAATKPTDFVEGEEYPSPVTQIIGLDYYDGVTAGVLKTASGSVYRFDMVDEEFNPDGLDRRTFVLAALPTRAFDTILSAIAPHIAPQWPCWVPIWKFPTEETRLSIEELIDQVLATAGKPAWRVESLNLAETVTANVIK